MNTLVFFFTTLLTWQDFLRVCSSDIRSDFIDSSSIRRSRRSSTKYVVEYYMVVDAVVYNLVKNRMQGTIRDPDVIIRKYYEMTIVNINVALGTLKSRGLDISAREAGLTIMKEPLSGVQTMEDPKTKVKYVMENNILTAFNHWVVNDAKLPKNDHVVLLTGYEMRSADKLKIFSTSFYNQICTHKSQSVVFMNLDPIFTYYAAHELAQSLGSGNRNLNFTTVYCTGLFSKILNGHTKKFFWAKYDFDRLEVPVCSYRLIDFHIAKLNNKGNNCLKTTTSSKITKEPYYGATMSVTEQCNMFTGTNLGSDTWSLMGRNPNICQHLPCYLSIDPKRSTRELMALTGTLCGDKKWCIRQKCVEDKENAPEFPKEKCPFPDDKFWCKNLKVTSCYKTSQHNFEVPCCKFCLSHHTGIEGCEYGDYNTKASCQRVLKSPRECFTQFYVRSCCKTCHEYWKKFA